ncbi:MAG: LysR family transcriptional regulator [Alphaproteobacteria bacterium]|nr:MAG: LysR family transcriptional regulator [Alphaproteobacteria bacterium]
MNIQALEIFIEVANNSSFAKVAKNRNVAPSSISRAIANLEDLLNLRLFHRTTRKVSLTEAGQTYFNKIEPILNDLKVAAETVHDIINKPSGKIKITSSVTFGNYTLLPILHEFIEMYPDINLDYVLSDEVIDLVDERVDISIRHGKLNDSSFIATKLFSTCYRVVASKPYIDKYDLPLTPSDITNHSCLIFNWPSFSGKWKFRKDDRSFEEISVSGRYSMTNGMALRDLTLRGAGVSLLANWLIDDDIINGDLVDLFPTYQVSAHNFDTAIWLMYPSREHIPLRVRLLINFIKQNLGSELIKSTI